jgi:hypothetical protein
LPSAGRGSAAVRRHRQDPVEDPAQIEHILEMALDGLRSRGPAA